MLAPIDLKVPRRYGRVPKGADPCRWLPYVRSTAYAGILALREAMRRHAGLP
jgi:hypothetical protein